MAVAKRSHTHFARAGDVLGVVRLLVHRAFERVRAAAPVVDVIVCLHSFLTPLPATLAVCKRMSQDRIIRALPHT